METEADQPAQARERRAAAAALAPGSAAALAIDLAGMVRFNSRIPVPVLVAGDDPAALPDFARAGRVLPVAALVIAAPAALVLWGTASLGLPAFVAAGLAIAALVATTGAFHEDGLADTADGLGGGHTAEQKLAIMRDSRIGSYGAVALGLALALRLGALAALLGSAGPAPATAALLAAAIVSRVLPLGLFHALPPARRDGAAALAVRPTRSTVAMAWLTGAFLAGLIALPAFGPLRFAAGLALALVATAALGWIAWRHIRGQTGDVLGACQQVTEIAFVLPLLISAGA